MSMTIEVALKRVKDLEEVVDDQSKLALVMVMEALEAGAEQLAKWQEVPFHKFLLEENERLKNEPKCSCISLLEEHRLTGNISSSNCEIHAFTEVDKVIALEEELGNLKKGEAKFQSRRALLDKLEATERELAHLRKRNAHLESVMDDDEPELIKRIAKLEEERDEAKNILKERMKIQSELESIICETELERNKLRLLITEAKNNSAISLEAALKRVAEVVGERDTLAKERQEAYTNGVQDGIGSAAKKVMANAKAAKEEGFLKGSALLTIVATEVLALGKK